MESSKILLKDGQTVDLVDGRIADGDIASWNNKPNVTIISKNDSVNISTSVDAETNTKTFDLSVDSLNITSSDGSINVSTSEGVTDLTLPNDVVRDSNYVHIDGATEVPLIDGNASAGVSTKYAREDHIHPTDTSREASSNKTTVILGTSHDKYPTDKAVAEFVNSSIATNTANYISNNGNPFTSVEQLNTYTGTVTNNDYAFVTGTDSEGNTYYDRYKATVKGSSFTWSLEYRLNNSSFTAAQWSAINSGITASLVAKIHEHSNKDVLDGITSSNVANWNSKMDNQSAGNISEPIYLENGIAKVATNVATTGNLEGKLNVDGSNATNAGVTAMLKQVSSGSGDLDDDNCYFGDRNSDHSYIVRRPITDLWNYIKKQVKTLLLGSVGSVDNPIYLENGVPKVATNVATKEELNAKQNSLSAGTGISISGNTISTKLPLSDNNEVTVKKGVWYIFAMSAIPDGGEYERCWDFLIASNHNSATQMRLFISPRISASGLFESDSVIQVEGHVTPEQLVKYKIATVKSSSGKLYCCLCVNHSYSGENRTVFWNIRNARPPSWWSESTPLSNYTVVSERMLNKSMSSNRLVCYKQTNNAAVGNATQPVYVDANGRIQACSSMPKFVIGTPAGAADTIYFT